MKILIYGVGGIGGFLGATLQNNEIDVSYIARGKRLKSLLKKGLVVKSKLGNKFIKKIKVSDVISPDDKFDFIFSTVKLYDFDEFLNQITLIKDKKFILIPFQNGVYAEKKASQIFGKRKVCTGVAQISSFVDNNQYVIHVGSLATFFVGTSDIETQKKLKRLCSISSLNGLDLRYKDNINEKVWQKFIFLSAYSGFTTAYNKTIGEIFENKNLRDDFIIAMNETFNLANYSKVIFRENPVEFWLKKIEKMPYEMTSSMHEDFKKNKKLELRWLSGSVVQQCKVHAEIVKKINSDLGNIPRA